jgi:copper chaperone
MNQASYKIGGMTCGGCTSSVTKALQQALPAAKVEVELESGLAHIQGEHDPKAVAETVEAAGFDFLGAQQG